MKMATIKVTFHPAAQEDKKGTITYLVSHNRKSIHIPTLFRISERDWNGDTDTSTIEHSKTSKITQQIEYDIAILNQIVKKLEKRGIDYSVYDIVRHYNSQGYKVLLFDYMDTLIMRMKATNRLGTARNYEKAKRSFKSFLDNEHLSIASLDEHLISDYYAFLIKKGLTRNSISFYMRILRAVYNKAVKQRIIEQSNPFSEVYTGIDNTRKRAIDESVILRLHQLELPKGSQLAFTRDLFIFSYCTRGMSFVDMAYLKKKDIQNGSLCYTRRKTGKLLMVRIEQSIQRIIDRYNTPETEYIFPIITSIDTSEAYHQYETALNTYNRMLRKLSKMYGVGCKLTSYTARHSWATAARNHNIPISIISAGMGHASEQTTRIYLTTLENSVIDEANLEIINTLIDSSIKEPE